MPSNVDPRVLFAAERTLLAWNRTGLALIAFGFLVERSGMIYQLLTAGGITQDRQWILWLGMAFILLGSCVAAFSAWQHGIVLRSIAPEDIPKGYVLKSGVVLNCVVALLGLLLGWALVVAH